MKNKMICFVYFTLFVFIFSGWINATEKLPTDLVWENGNTEPVFASSNAKKGGTYRDYLTSFPLTLRTVGPDSNTGIRTSILGNQMGLLELHPNTEKWLPALAKEWAYGKDNKTMYFKLDKRAQWSDGKPLTVDDFIFGMEFMRSEHIVAPWYNNRYRNDYDRVIKYDDYTFAIILTKPTPDLAYNSTFPPQPKHFYKKLTKDFVRKYNWKIIPNTGPYQISKLKKGKRITFMRNKNWWAKDLKYNKGRYNVDKVIYTVVRESTTVFEYFKKKKLDSHILTFPILWHQKTKDLEIYNNGYIKKLWFYTDTQEPMYGLFINEDREIFKDINVRFAFAHAMNMDKLLNGLLRGDYLRLHSDTTGYGKYTNTKIKARTFNIEKVTSLMTKSGWKRGKDGIWGKGNKRYSVNAVYSFDLHTERLVLLKEEAKKAGIEMKLQKLDGSTAYKLVMEKKHDVAWWGWGASWRPQYWGQFHSVNAHKAQTNNITNTDDKELDKYIITYRDSLDINERIDMSHKIQQKIYEIGSYIPTYKVSYFRTAYWRWWKFPKTPATKLSDTLFEPFTVGIFWLDQQEKEKTLAAMDNDEAYPPETIIDKTFKVD